MTITVVVADDQDLVRAGLVSIVGSFADVRVVGEAVDGAQAVEVVLAERPDIALLDIRMPLVDGIEAIRRLRSDPALGGVRLVVLTTFGIDEYVFEALRAGADGFLLKDVEPAELERSIRALADGDSVISPGVTRALVDDFLSRSEPRTSTVVPSLTPREADILALVCRGATNRDIALALFIGEATVKSYVSRLLEKFAVTSRVALVVAAYDAGLAPSPG